jgi:transposase
MPARAIVASGPEADCARAESLAGGIPAGHLIAGKGYDADKIEAMAREKGAGVCTPPRKGRKNPRHYDERLYKPRHLAENALLRLKEWRGIATRYAKRQSSFLPGACSRCAIIWASIS